MNWLKFKSKQISSLIPYIPMRLLRFSGAPQDNLGVQKQSQSLNTSHSFSSRTGDIISPVIFMRSFIQPSHCSGSCEVSIKYALGKLPLPETPQNFLPAELGKNRIESLPIIDVHAFQAGLLPRSHHSDSFDRIPISRYHQFFDISRRYADHLDDFFTLW